MFVLQIQELFPTRISERCYQWDGPHSPDQGSGCCHRQNPIESLKYKYWVKEYSEAKFRHSELGMKDIDRLNIYCTSTNKIGLGRGCKSAPPFQPQHHKVIASLPSKKRCSMVLHTSMRSIAYVFEITQQPNSCAR